MTWLVTSLSRMTLESEAEEYLYTRGAREERIQSLQCVTWNSEVAEGCPSYLESRYGEGGRSLDGCLITPYHSPTGDILGFEARRFDADNKWVSDFRCLPKAKWNPVGIGLDSDSLSRLSSGEDLWLCEGQFDLYALDWVIPSVIFATVKAGVTYQHQMLIRRFVSGQVFICYDADETGRGEAAKAQKWLSRMRVTSHIVTFSGGKDPGDLWDQGGQDRLQQEFKRYIP